MKIKVENFFRKILIPILLQKSRQSSKRFASQKKMCKGSPKLKSHLKNSVKITEIHSHTLSSRYLLTPVRTTSSYSLGKEEDEKK